MKLAVPMLLLAGLFVTPSAQENPHGTHLSAPVSGLEVAQAARAFLLPLVIQPQRNLKVEALAQVVSGPLLFSVVTFDEDIGGACVPQRRSLRQARNRQESHRGHF